MSKDEKQRVLTILPGLQYLAREAQTSGAGPVSGWIGETIERIVVWVDSEHSTQQPRPATAQPAVADPILVGCAMPDSFTTAISLKAALSYLLVDAQDARLDDTARFLQQTVAALEDEIRRFGRLN